MSPSDLLATPVPDAFQNVALAIIIERQNNLSFSDQCQTKFLLPKSQMNSTIFSRFLRALHRWKYTNSNPHCVLRAIKVLKEDEKHIVIGFRHLQ